MAALSTSSPTLGLADTFKELKRQGRVRDSPSFISSQFAFFTHLCLYGFIILIVSSGGKLDLKINPFGIYAFPEFIFER